MQMENSDYRHKTKYYYARQKLYNSQPGNQHQGLLKLQLEQPVVSAKRLWLQFELAVCCSPPFTANCLYSHTRLGEI